MKTPPMTRRALVGSALLCLTGVAASQSPGAWPDRPIRFVVAGPVGGGMDTFTRMIAEKVQTSLKQAVFVENRPGANGILGNGVVAKAPGDGHTFLFTASSSIAINPLMVARMPYDTQRDLVPVTQMGTGGIVLVANPSTGFTQLKDVVEFARKNPGKLSYGSWGNGSTGHLVMEGIKKEYGVFITHIPYPSTAGEVVDLLGGRIDIAFTDVTSPLPHIRSGKLTALGVTGAGRGPGLPDVPTLAEQNYKFDAEGWFGVFAPAGTPATIVRRMNEEINKTLATDELRQRFTALNLSIPPSRSAVEFAEIVKADMRRWQGLAKAINLTPQ